jgi:hypothetical protein
MEDFSESSSVRMEREMLFMGDGSVNSIGSGRFHSSNSSSMKMRMRQQEPLEDTSDSTPQEDVMEDHSNTSIEAFDNEIRRMTKDADKILDDIRQSSRSHTTTNVRGRGYRSVRPSSSTTKSASIIIEEEKTHFIASDNTYHYYGETDTDDDADTIDDDDNASLQSELARLDRVAALQQQQQQEKLGPHDKNATRSNNKTVLVDVMSPWKWPPQNATIIDTERASSAGADPEQLVNDLSLMVGNTTAMMMTATILWGMVLYLVAHGLLVRLVDDDGQVRIWW